MPLSLRSQDFETQKICNNISETSKEETMGNAIPETSHVLANFVPQTTFQSVDYLIVSTNTTAILIGQIASVVRNITNSRFDWIIGVCYSGNSLRAKSDYLRNKNCASVN